MEALLDADGKIHAASASIIKILGLSRNKTMFGRHHMQQ